MYRGVPFATSRWCIQESGIVPTGICNEIPSKKSRPKFFGSISRWQTSPIYQIGRTRWRSVEDVHWRPSSKGKWRRRSLEIITRTPWNRLRMYTLRWPNHFRWKKWSRWSEPHPPPLGSLGKDLGHPMHLRRIMVTRIVIREHLIVSHLCLATKMRPFTPGETPATANSCFKFHVVAPFTSLSHSWTISSQTRRRPIKISNENVRYWYGKSNE